MFFYLSKLIPLFFYPLGLTCILLLIALVLLWRKPRLAAIPIALSIVVLLLSSNAWVSNWLVSSLEFQNLPLKEIPKADAIVVLGGCTHPAFPPRPWVEVNEAGDRVLYAAKLYREGKATKVILSGGRINPLERGLSEAEDMAMLATAMGVPASAILQDKTSLNTRENAVNVKQIIQQNGIRRILLVTSAIHMPRSLRIFQKLGIDTIPTPTDFLTSDLRQEELNINAQSLSLSLLPEAEELQRVTRALKEYVGIVVYWLRGWA